MLDLVQRRNQERHSENGAALSLPLQAHLSACPFVKDANHVCHLACAKTLRNVCDVQGKLLRYPLNFTEQF